MAHLNSCSCILDGISVLTFSTFSSRSASLRGGTGYFPGEYKWNLDVWLTNDTFSCTYFAIPLTVTTSPILYIHHIAP
jgi:hypothetical protein